ncbi:SDR family NAD(P)-dependent oxidoreductase [Arthrobacter sp. zg-Y750]|uniref:SDR family NAD(P)-dependent oxidoreductase n=1 Tax=Arthrobacter sp. zg-Y750 TaxID=2894189 RepID=UPI001E401A6D|nr:SDR family NAD(P)-dependent oxidoreductase [Arthrobacter sp. zg-Y750]MCC9178749.1 SDR family NAD(P)-dependent oxidoreductase [Arthrobacter sp. zg-Y750]
MELLMPVLDFPNQTILITGASSGIGAAFARALAARGAGLVLVARRRDRLDALAAELRAAHGVTVNAITQDLGSPSAGAELSAAVAAAGLQVTGVINNAGFGTFGDFVEEDPDRLAQEIAVDISAPVQISAAFLPGMVKAGTGFLINVASMAAYTPTPRMAVYGAAKAFVLSFTESLWAETRGTGVTVFALSPGATSTEFNAVVGTDDATAGARMRTPDDVVATALSHLARRNPGPSVIDGRLNRVSATAARMMSRRGTVAVMRRVTDPARRKDADVVR